MLALADAPDREADAKAGTLPMVHWHSWWDLRNILLDCGIEASVLQSAKEQMDLKGGYTIPEVALSVEQLRKLEFLEL